MGPSGSTQGGRTGESQGPDLEWFGHDGFFKVVEGNREARELLSDKRLAADLVAMFKGAGLTSGPVFDAAKASLLSMNGEAHHRYRSLIAPHFTPRAVERVRGLVRSEATSLAVSLLSDDRCEIISDFAAPYVTVGICEHVGFSPGEVAGLTGAIERLGWSMRDLSNRTEECTSAMTELLDYSRATIASRSGAPGDDVLGTLAEAVDAGAITPLAATVLAASLLSAGHEPTIFQIAIMVLTLSEHPTLWDGLGEGSVAVAPVVEELLRYRSTNLTVNRRVDQAMEHRGLELREGEQILISIAAANHDPRTYPAPDEVDPDLNRGSHLAYGFGQHYCLGAALSRVQLQEAVAALTSKLECPEVLEVVETEGTGLQGPTKLTVRVRARTG